MEFRVLAIGDVTSEEGTAHLRRHLPGFKKMKGVDFTVINGENISGTGLTPQQADDLFAAGADVITLGNHTWGKMQITDYLRTAISSGLPTSPPALRAGATGSMTWAGCRWR